MRAASWEELSRIYSDTLADCDPLLHTKRVLAEANIRRRIDYKVDIVSIGKAARPLGLAAVRTFDVGRSFFAGPRGYLRGNDLPPSAHVALGSHPRLSEASFRCGDDLIDFVTAGTCPIVFLLSGGGSATVERPLEPYFSRKDLLSLDSHIALQSLPIAKLNTVRKHLSSIKGGRLGSIAPEGSLAFVLSDVSAGDLHHVASGPVLPDPTTNREAAEILRSLDSKETSMAAAHLEDNAVPDTPKALPLDSELIADNRTLVESARRMATRIGFDAVVLETAIEMSVSEAADFLYEAATSLAPGEVLIAGGEPTVPSIDRSGRGGRCSELLARFAKLCIENALAPAALFGSSDGMDGNTSAAAFVLKPKALRSKRASIESIHQALAESDSMRLVDALGEAIITGPTENNLRDLFLIAAAE